MSIPSEYTKPLIELMESVPAGEKVILVGNCLGGISLAFAMDRFPHRISAAVFLTAFMPDSANSPSYVLEQWAPSSTADGWLDAQFSYDPHPTNPKAVIRFGPKILAATIYQLSSPQDLALAEMLIRPGSIFKEDLSKEKPFSEGYGSVSRVYIVCKKDSGIAEDYQRWMIDNNPVKEVMEIDDAGHMAMLTKPHELCCCLLDVAKKYS